MILYDIILYYTILYYTILYYSILYYTILYYTRLTIILWYIYARLREALEVQGFGILRLRSPGAECYLGRRGLRLFNSIVC